VDYATFDRGMASYIRKLPLFVDSWS